MCKDNIYDRMLLSKRMTDCITPFFIRIVVAGESDRIWIHDVLSFRSLDNKKILSPIFKATQRCFPIDAPSESSTLLGCTETPENFAEKKFSPTPILLTQFYYPNSPDPILVPQI